jgi:uncharacterized protein (TIGR02246 family)
MASMIAPTFRSALRAPGNYRSWIFQHLGPVIALALTITSIQTARADSDADKAAIVQRLQRWTAAFNAKDALGTCDLFAPDLVYSIPEIVRGTRETICSNLATLQGRSDIKLHYDNPDIHEILVAGDVAVVRLTWTLTTEVNGARDTTTEEGMDIFRRQPDGRWSIARFIAFTTRANKLLR